MIKKDTEALRLSGVSCRFSNGKGVGPVSLTVSWGKLCSLIGSNGSGKSTLLRCTGLFEAFQTGTIEINGAIWRPEHEGWTKKLYKTDEMGRFDLGFVHQNAEPWPHLSVLDNITLPLIRAARLSESEARERADRELERFGLTETARSMPYQLSGGTRQRVTLARALALNPRVLLLDEVTSALDPEWTETVRNILRAFVAEGGSVVFVSHRLSLVRHISDYVVYLSQGRIIAEGPPKKVMDAPDDPGLRRFLENS